MLNMRTTTKSHTSLGLFLVMLWGFVFLPKAQATRISLLVCPGNSSEVYTLFGHAALRVVDDQGEDWVYNWGVFDFDAPNFMWKYILGRADSYMLAKQPTSSYIPAYTGLGVDVKELELNLTTEEKEALLNVVETNLLPENRFYRYNFVFDNCATRLLDILQETLQNNIQLPSSEHPLSYREMIDECTKEHAWVTLGTYLALGKPASDPVGTQERCFLPSHLSDVVCKTLVLRPEAPPTPLVEAIYTYPATAPPFPTTGGWLTSPKGVAWVILALTIVFLCMRRKKPLPFRLWGTLLFIVLGLVGIVLFFLAAISQQPLTAPNYNLLALHPLQLVTAWLVATNSQKGVWVYWWHLANVLLCLILLLCASQIGQEIHTAVYLLTTAALLVSSGKLFDFYRANKRK